MVKYFKTEELSYPVGMNLKVAEEYALAAALLFDELNLSGNVNIWCRGSSGTILASF